LTLITLIQVHIQFFLERTNVTYKCYVGTNRNYTTVRAI